MTWWRDILRQCLFMSVFIIPIPIGAYTIHNGSSAAVAAITYTILSICIPVAYIGTTEATFGIENQRIGRKAFILAWLVVSACLVWGILYWDTWWKTAAFWEWPTIVRDIVFIVGMYGEVSVMMLLAYGFSCLGRAGSSERGETK